MASLTPNMVKALSAAKYNPSRVGVKYSDSEDIHTGWNMYGTDGRTLAAMVRRGLALEDGALTPVGVKAKETIFDRTEYYARVAESQDTVMSQIQNDESETEGCVSFIGLGPTANGEVTMFATPTRIASWIESGFLHQHSPKQTPTHHSLCRCPSAPVEPVKADYTDADAFDSAMRNADDTGRERGFERLSSEWFEVFEASYARMQEQNAAIKANNTPSPLSFVGVRQGLDYMVAIEHIHAADCRDIAREMKRYGKSETFDYPEIYTIADILADSYGDIASDNAESDSLEWWQEICANANDNASDGYAISGMRIMPCARRIIETGEPEGGWILTVTGMSATGDKFTVTAPEIELPEPNGVHPCWCGTCFNDTMGKLCHECEAAECSVGKDCCVLPEPEYDAETYAFDAEYERQQHSPMDEPTESLPASYSAPIVLPEGIVVSAALYATWSYAQRALSLWPQGTEELEWMINDMPEWWFMYTLPNGDIVATPHVDGSVTAVYVVERNLPEFKVSADIGIAIPGLDRTIPMGRHNFWIEAEDVSLSDIAGRFVDSMDGWPSESVANIRVTDIRHLPWN